MLFPCPECNREISNAASTCPHCGYPIAEIPAPDSHVSSIINNELTWNVITGNEQYSANLETLRQWYTEKRFHPSDKVLEPNGTWRQAKYVKDLRRVHFEMYGVDFSDFWEVATKFKERLSRKLFISIFSQMFLANLIVGVGFGFLAGALEGSGVLNENRILDGLLTFGFFAWFLYSAIIAIGIAIQRFHDLRKSGWMTLLLFIPLVNVAMIIYLLATEGRR